MAEITLQKVTTTRLTLELTDKEAEILAAMLQNPFDEDETQEASNLRRSIFEALKPPSTLTRDCFGIK